jgi:hypothetical protein
VFRSIVVGAPDHEVGLRRVPKAEKLSDEGEINLLICGILQSLKSRRQLGQRGVRRQSLAVNMVFEKHPGVGE